MKTFIVQVLLLSCLFAIGWASEIKNWNTLYSLEDGKIYLHLKTNDIIVLNFTLTGEAGDDSQYSFSDSDVALEDNQKLNSIAGPPENTTLFLAGTRLYGLTAGSQDSDKDLCGAGVLGLVEYKEDTNHWDDISDKLDLDELEDKSIYQYPSVLYSPLENNTVYVYGGVCEKTGLSNSRLLSLDLSMMKFSNITTTTKPQSFYGASSMFAPSPNNQLIIGGESNSGWLNMYQLATWNFESGWSFEQISKSEDDTVGSRIFPLSLPIFSKLKQADWEYVTNNFKVEKILLIGGEDSHGDASPKFGELTLETNNWEWVSKDSGSLDYDSILGAASIFDTLVVVNSSTSKTKRDSESNQYSINLYDTSNFNVLDEFSPKPKKDSSDSSTSEVKTKAILGTLIPVSALAMAIAAGVFVVKRRKLKREEDSQSIDYQFGQVYDQESALDEKYKGLAALGLDSNSTIDAASLDSWVKKRQEFEGKNRLGNNHTASNETLSPQVQPPDLIHSPVMPPGRLNRSLSKLKQSFTFTPIPSHRIISGDTKLSRNMSTQSSTSPRRRTLFFDQDGLSTYSEEPDSSTLHNPFDDPQPPSPENSHIDNQDNNSDTESLVDYSMDAQVLVSSKRRSVLRVTNPDLHTVEEEEEDLSSSSIKADFRRPLSLRSSIRQRIPSEEDRENI